MTGTNVTAALLDKLKEKQEQLGLNDVAFAERLGVSRTLWAFVKSGERVPGQKFLQAVMAAFPELKLDVFNYMDIRSRVNAGKES
jgi:transcriptional regulator with XRE-family HTH domain